MPVPTRAPLGCLLLHGLTSSLATVDALAPECAARGLPCRLPVLRGHGGVPTDLQGVTWRDWYADASAALDDLTRDCDRALAIGLSMGGVVALHLAATRPERLAGVVAIAPALRLAGSPRAQARVALAALRGTQVAVDPRNAYQDATLATRCTNYPTLPARAALSLARYGYLVERLLPRVTIPLLVVYTPRDRVVRPEAARRVFDRVATPPNQKQLVAFPDSGHEMLQDRARDAVLATIARFIDTVRETGAGAPVGTKERQ